MITMGGAITWVADPIEAAIVAYFALLAVACLVLDRALRRHEASRRQP